MENSTQQDSTREHWIDEISDVLQEHLDDSSGLSGGIPALLDGPVARMIADAEQAAGERVLLSCQVLDEVLKEDAEQAAERRGAVKITPEVVAELIAEWRRTCKTMGIPYTDRDAAAFVAEGLS